jgi:hypothetical protein
VAEKLCGGSLVPILSHLARSKALSEKERRALRELIDRPGEKGDAERRGPGTGPKGGNRKG